MINFSNREGDGATLSGDDTATDPDKVAAHQSDRVGFPVDESIFIDFRVIPKKTKNIVVFLTNYTGGGFCAVSKLFCRIVDITNEKDPSSWRYAELLRAISLANPPNPQGAMANAGMSMSSTQTRRKTPIPRSLA